jgi:hypothetical protein
VKLNLLLSIQNLFLVDISTGNLKRFPHNSSNDPPFYITVIWYYDIAVSLNMHAKILKTACKNKRCCYLQTIIYLQRSRVLTQTEEDRPTDRPTNQPTNQPTKQPTKELRAETYAKAQVDGPSVCLTIPALTVSLGSIADTLNYKWDCAYANDFPSRSETPTWAN